MLTVPEQSPAAPLAVFRMVVGAVAAVKALDWAARILLQDPTLQPLYGFLPALPAAVWLVLAVAMLTAAVTAAVGYRARPALLVTAGLAMAFICVGGFYANHAYLMATLAVLLSFTDSDAALSVRARRGGGRETVWAPPVYLLRAQITIVYIYAALAKLNPDFLSGNALASWHFSSLLAPDFLISRPILMTMAIGAIVCELFVAFALWFRRLRPVAIVIGVALHLGMIAFISAGVHHAVLLGLFAALMIGGYALFLERLPDAVTRAGSDSRRKVDAAS
ncbi:HTTM domain-containing protein [Blastococcus sp. SYSU DS0617]